MKLPERSGKAEDGGCYLVLGEEREVPGKIGSLISAACWEYGVIMAENVIREKDQLLGGYCIVQYIGSSTCSNLSACALISKVSTKRSRGFQDLFRKREANSRTSMVLYLSYHQATLHALTCDRIILHYCKSFSSQRIARSTTLGLATVKKQRHFGRPSGFQRSNLL